MNFRNSGKMPLIWSGNFGIWSVKSQGILLFMIGGNPV